MCSGNSCGTKCFFQQRAVMWTACADARRRGSRRRSGPSGSPLTGSSSTSTLLDPPMSYPRASWQKYQDTVWQDRCWWAGSVVSCCVKRSILRPHFIPNHWYFSSFTHAEPLLLDPTGAVSRPCAHNGLLVMAFRNLNGPCQLDIFKQAGLMIGFGAGVGHMSAIVGLQTCCNELVRAECEFVWRNREAVVGSPSCVIFQHLPGIGV